MSKEKPTTKKERERKLYICSCQKPKRDKYGQCVFCTRVIQTEGVLIDDFDKWLTEVGNSKKGMEALFEDYIILRKLSKK